MPLFKDFFFLPLLFWAHAVKFVILEKKTASIFLHWEIFFSPLSALPPLFIRNIYFLLTREELLLILPWNSGRYSGSVLGYLIKSQYARLSIASTSEEDFAQGACCSKWTTSAFFYWLWQRTTQSPWSVSYGFLSVHHADESNAVTGGQQSLLASLSRERLPPNLRQAGADR